MSATRTATTPARSPSATRVRRTGPPSPLWAALLLPLAACAGSVTQSPAPAPASAEVPAAAPPPEATAAPVPPPPEEPPPPELAFPEEAFRAQQPAPDKLRPFKTPPLQRFSLPGGISVFLVERHNLPIVSMSLVFEGGGFVDPKGKDGLASVCSTLMSEGTQALGKIEMEEALADIASSVESGSSDDQHFVSLGSLKKNLAQTLDLWGDTLLKPGMRQDELDRSLKRRIAGLQQTKGNPAAVAQRLSDSVVYGPDHLFGRFPTEASYGAITLADCQSFLADYVKPQGARLFVVGDVTKAEVTEQVGARLKGWTGKPKKAPSPTAAKPRAGKVFFVDMPNAPQSVVQLLHLGPPRTAGDYQATSIMSGILGGGFSSRINMNIREKHGYAYGARGGFDYDRKGSTFRAAASVRTDVTKESILEMWKEIRGLREGEPTEQELTREKDNKVLSVPAQFSTGGQTLGAFRELIYYGLPLNYFDTLVPKVQAVNKGAVKQAASKHLKLNNLQLLVVGDGKVVLPKLKELAEAKEWGGGKITLLDPDGKPLENELSQR
jgi:zinc protease